MNDGFCVNNNNAGKRGNGGSGDWKPARKKPASEGRVKENATEKKFFTELPYTPQRQQAAAKKGGGGQSCPPPPPNYFQAPSQQPGGSSRQGEEQKSKAQYTVPQPMPPATQVHNRQGICSIWTLNVEKGRKAYRYDVNIERLPMPKRNGEMDKGKSLVKGQDDGQKALHRNLCYELIATAFSKTQRFGMPVKQELVYDCSATMFTSTPIKNRFDIDIENNEVNDYVKTYCGNRTEVRFKVTIERNAACPELDLNDLRQYQSQESVFHEDRSLRAFFEIAIAQFGINRGQYVAIGAGRLFESGELPNSFERVGNGMILRKGLAKGVRVIRNDMRTPKCAVVLDTKVAAFFERQPLVNTVLDIKRARGGGPRPTGRDFTADDYAHVQRVLEDVRVEVNYRRVRTFECGHLTDRPIGNIQIDYQNQADGSIERVSIPDYFRRKYGFRLERTDLPGMIPNTPLAPGQKPEVFPLELLTVMEDQRVPREKTDPRLMDRLLAHNSMRPDERMAKIEERARSLGLFNDQNPVLRAFGIGVDQTSNRIPVGLRALPELRFNRNVILRPDRQKGEWRRDAGRAGYLEGGTPLKNWVVLCERHCEREVVEFVKRLCQMTRQKNIQMDQPEIVSFRSPEESYQEWQREFAKFANQKKQFIMLVDPLRRDSHGLLKLSEATFKVTTQHVTLEKVQAVVQQNQRQTLENILNKLNCKNSGLNYAPIVEPSGRKFALENGEVLVIGYDVAHPAPMPLSVRRKLAAQGETRLSSLESSVVGICANMTENPHNFCGDYFYQESCREAVDVLQLGERVKWILKNVKENRRKRGTDLPQYIFILRDGLSEGQFAMACKDELGAIKKACLEYDRNYRPKIVMVVGTKTHFKKFFLEGQQQGRNGLPLVENLVPGSVIQEKVVRADITEFFLQPHAPLKGTGKAVEYAVLEDGIGVSQDELHALIMGLCYSHQIVNVAVSVPEPVYQADELAKRGKNNYTALKKFVPDLPRKDRVLVGKRGSNSGSVSIVDYDNMTERLSYWGKGTQCLSHRFTA